MAADVRALMYHDVVSESAADASGFPGRDAAQYKLSPERFAAHLAAIVRALGPADTFRSADASRSNGPVAPALVLTFDDGGIGALRAADALERHGLRGRFFVTTGWLGGRGFLDRRDLRDLRARGHLVGSHSCTHPLRMAHCSTRRIREEWTRSRDVLSELLGEPVDTASVPGGDYAPHVAREAAGAGYTTLFTSEPTTRPVTVDGLVVRGRYTIRRHTSARTAAALASGAALPAVAQTVAWSVRKLTKRATGPAYLRMRRLLLRHGEDVRWGDVKG